MGGLGSGRRSQEGKHTTTDLQALDIRRLSRNGLLAPGQSFVWTWTVNDKRVASIRVRVGIDHLFLSYRARSRDGWQQMEFPVFLQWTRCHFGGQRVWFICPIQQCGRRVAILYGGNVFACRHCQQLAYESQRETVDDRAARRAETIRRRLNWEPGILNGNAGKPKGMHHRTYDRLVASHETHVKYCLAVHQLRMVMKYGGTGISPEYIYRVLECNDG
jgi:hypothetical protein